MSARSTTCADVSRPAMLPLKFAESSRTGTPFEIVMVLEPAVPPLWISSWPPLVV
jgi:hypothetical protein